MIDTKSIRAKVLDLAIRGKLTKQLPEDGTAEELYQLIQAEKQVLIVAEKGKKGNPLPEEGEDEAAFEIPDGWKWVRLSELVCKQIKRGKSPRYAETGKTLVFAQKCNTKAGYIDLRKALLLDETTLAKYPEDEFMHDGDIVINSTGTGTLGRVGIYRSADNPTGQPIVPDSHVTTIRLYGQIDSTYVYWFLKQQQPLLESMGTGSTNQKELSAADLSALLVPLPSLPEQHRIVAKIDTIFSLLDTIDALQSAYTANQKALRAKLIDAAIRGQLTEQLPEDGTAEELYRQIQAEKSNILLEKGGRDDKSIRPINGEIPYDLPVTWKWIRFGDIGLFKKGPFGSALTKSMFVPKSEATIKVYEQQHAINKNKNLGTYYITAEYFDEKMKGFEVRPGDVIISCAGTIGETYILPDDIERGIINQALMRVTIVPSIDKKYFQYFFDARLKRNAQNESNGSAINNIPPFEVLKNWYFPLSPLAEQKRIVAKLEQLLPLCEG